MLNRSGSYMNGPLRRGSGQASYKDGMVSVLSRSPSNSSTGARMPQELRVAVSVKEAEMARVSNGPEGGAATAERPARTFNSTPARRADAIDAPERKNAGTPASGNMPAGSIAAIEARLGF